MVIMSPQFTEIVDRHATNSRLTPGCQFAVSMFADNKGMNTSAVHSQMFSQFIPESAGIQYRSGADDPVGRIAGFLQGYISQNVYRIGDNEQDSFKGSLFNLPDNGLHNGTVFPDQIQSRLVGLLVGTGSDHNDCGIRNIIIRTRIDLHGTGKCHAMTDIHSFSFRTIMIGIDQYHFRKKLTLHQGKRGRRSHKSAAHYNYLSTVNTHNSDLLSFTLSLFQNQMPDVYTMDR